MKLEIINPRNAMQTAPLQGLTAERVSTLDGKRIAIVSEKPDGCLYLVQLQKILQKRHPTATVDIITGFVFWPLRILDELKTYDTFIYGVRNTAAFNTEPEIRYEKAGIPGVFLCVGDNLYGQAKRNTVAFGLPGLRMYQMPTERWPGEDETESFVKLAEETVEDIEKLLTTPLTEEEKHPEPPVFDTADMVFEGADYDECYEKFQTTFFERGYTDGLAVAPPTPEAVKKMLAGTSRDPKEVIKNTMTPGYGIVTIEKIAVNAVMAGAKPEYLPVIITAVEMLCDEHYCAFHVIATVCSTQLMISVNGPLAKEIGMSSTFGYMGPGNRANSTIGRAVSLCCINLGWMDFKIDGGMRGQPSRYCNLTFTENEELSPWEPWRVTLGYDAEDSTVQIDEILHVDGDWPFEIARMPSCTWTYGWKNDLDRLAERAIGSRPTMLENAVKKAHDIHKMSLSDNDAAVDVNALISSRTYYLLIYPGQARELAEKGYKTKEDVRKYIRDSYRYPFDELTDRYKEAVIDLAKSGRVPGLTLDDCKPGGTIPVVNSNKIAIIVAGPLQGQTVGLSSMGGYGGVQVPEPFEVPPATPWFMKKITGATLTKYGK